MPFNKNWNLDFYKTEYESDEHWQLRRRFMELHQDKFPEDELVCLAQVFVNVEFMGCKYPDETMRVVGELSQDVAREFREARSNRLKRTFVKASTAAEARAKGMKRSHPNSHTDSQARNRSNEMFRKRPAMNLLAGLPFGNFILFLLGDRNAIPISGQRCKVEVIEKEEIVQGKRKVSIFVGGKLAGSGNSPALKVAKQEAFDQAFARLQEECFTIKLSLDADRIDITKNNQTVVCSLKSSVQEVKLDSNNIGYKMMQKLGWSGGGLGSAQTGRENPVDFLIKNNRRGLGNASGDINKAYFANMLENYIKSDDIRDLYFDKQFTKDERAGLHQIAQSKNLKSASHGKEPNRFLVISKKNIPPIRILEEVLIHRNAMYLNKYVVTVPIKKRNEFPDHHVVESP